MRQLSLQIQSHKGNKLNYPLLNVNLTLNFIRKGTTMFYHRIRCTRQGCVFTEVNARGLQPAAGLPTHLVGE